MFDSVVEVSRELGANLVYHCDTLLQEVRRGTSNNEVVTIEAHPRHIRQCSPIPEGHSGREEDVEGPGLIGAGPLADRFDDVIGAMANLRPEAAPVLGE